jgi:hypothetical protein
VIKRSLAAIAALLWLFCATHPAPAADTPAPKPPPAATDASSMLDLFEAYQGGYMQVVSVCCFQLYYSTGVIATDFNKSYIDADTATFALQKNSLLHSVCITTIKDVFDKTPADDTVARAELKRLWDILISEDALLRALADALASPSAGAQAKVDPARQAVEKLLDQYTASMAQ